MNRVMIIGCCGAGKSTFAKKLSHKTCLPLIHLDQYYWQPEWTETAPEKWKKIVVKLASGNHWIIDGNYGSTLSLRFSKADTIIYLDYPTWKCFYRVVKRIFTYWGKERPDMPQGCKERFDWDFLHYVAVFNLTKRKRLLHQLNLVQKNASIHIFTNDQEAYQFLESLVSKV